MSYRATSPRRDIREANTLTNEANHVPVSTPIHPDAPQERTKAKGPAYAQSIYERRMDRSRSPNTVGQDAGATPSRNNVASQYYSQYTPSRGTSATPSTFGAVGGAHTPSQSILADRQQLSRASPIAASTPYFAGAVAIIPNGSSVPPTRGSSTNPHELALTAPDRAMLEMLISEAQDRHFVEKLFVAQEEKHERNQWLSIEAHRRRMLQMSYAGPLRIARMEAAQEHRVGHLIAEYEVGEEIMDQRRRMDDRVSELRSVIETTNRYRDALEELESESKANHERQMAELEDDRRSKKRLLDELSRQYEFTSIHSRTDDLYSSAFGLRAGLEYQRANRRDPDPLKSPSSATARAVETTADPRQASAAASSLPQAIRDLASPSALGFRHQSTNYSTMTNFNATPQRAARGGSSSPNAAPSSFQHQLSSPAAPLAEPTTSALGTDYSDVVAQSQRALERAEELERSAASGSRIARGRSNNTL